MIASALSPTSSSTADNSLQCSEMVQDGATDPPIHSDPTAKENGFASSDLEKGREAPPTSNPPRGRRWTAGQTEEEDENEREGDDMDEPPLERAPSSARSQSISLPIPKRKEESVLQLFSTISLLIFATIWGVLARLGLLWIGGFAEGAVFSLIWAQMVGCLVMGFVVERKKGLEKLYAPLFVACGTGFCGSLTTFSSWMHDVFAGFANVDEPTLGRFNGFLTGVAITIVTLGLSQASLTVGDHLSSLLPRIHLPPLHLPSRTHLALITLGPLFWLGAIFLLAFGPHTWRHRATFAIVLGPPGTLLRYLLSRRLNPRYPSLPLGTLAANTLAVLIFAIIALLQRTSGVSSTGCAALQGVLDGFCGSLSTVSTFVVELRALGRRDSYRYFGVSWLLGQALMMLILGSWLWGADRGEACSV